MRMKGMISNIQNAYGAGFLTGADSKKTTSAVSQPIENSTLFINPGTKEVNDIASLSNGENVPIGKIPDLPKSLYYNCLFKHIVRPCSCFFHYNHYKIENNKGINCDNARDVDIALAKYAKATAETMDSVGLCYTGVKRAFNDAGVLSDYGDMPKNYAYLAKGHFDMHPEAFKKLDVPEEELKNLPAGKIIVYHAAGEIGHIAITNGNGQEMSDSTDNMEWIKEKRQSGKEKIGYDVYELTENWWYDKETKKLCNSYYPKLTKLPTLPTHYDAGVVGNVIRRLNGELPKQKTFILSDEL